MNPQHSAPQTSADRLRARAHDSEGDRRFVVGFLATWLVLSGVATAFVVLVDPFATWGTGLVPTATWPDRDEKVSLFDAAPAPPEALVLGSSRSMKLNPSCIESLTGMRAFNFGVSSARAEDFLAIYRYVTETRGARLRTIFLGLDPDSLHDHAPVDRRLATSPVLAKYVTVKTGPKLGEVGPELLGMPALAASYRSVRVAMAGTAAPGDTIFKPNGFIAYVKWEEAIRAGKFSFAETFPDSVVSFRARYAEFGGLWSARVAALRDMLVRARAAGTTVYVFIPPLHPELMRATADLPVEQRTADAIALLRGLEGEGLLRFIDVTRLETFGGDPNAYFDGFHMMESNTTRLLMRIFPDRPRPDIGCAL